MKKSIKRCVPSKVLDKLNSLDYPNKDHLYIICDMIYRRRLYIKEETDYSNNFIDIPINYFRDMIVDPNYLKNAFQFLYQHQILECDNNYSKVGGKCLGYRFLDNYISKVVEVELSSKPISKRIINNYKSRNSHVNEKYKTYKQYFLSSFKIDFKKSVKFIDNSLHSSLLPPYVGGFTSASDQIRAINRYNSLFISLAAIRDGDLFFRKNKTNGRIDTNLTNLKSELRQFITTPNLIQIDVTNSQPFLLSLILPKDILHHEDVKKYINWTHKGVFYENFQREYHTQKNILLTRKKMKDIMFCILYSKNDNYIKEKQPFRSLFPNVIKYIEDRKKKNHNELAISMQKLESDFCIDTVLPELDKKGIKYYTIHDSWLVNISDELHTRRIIEDLFLSKYNTIPKLKVEEINVKTRNKVYL